MDTDTNAKMEQSMDMLLQMLNIFFVANDNEDVKAFVTRHSHLLLPDYSDGLLDVLIEKTDGYERCKFIVLKGLLEDCRERGIEKAFEFFNHNTYVTQRKIYNLIMTYKNLAEKREFIEKSSSILLSDLAIVLILEFVKSIKDTGLIGVIKEKSSLDDWKLNLVLLLHCREKGIANAFREIEAGY